MNKLLNRFERLRDERGFTMAYVMLFMLVGSLFAVAAWGSVNSDTRQTQSDKDSKAAYAAAESGLNWYLYRLDQDNGVWTDCDTPATLPDGSANPVNQPWNGTGADPRRWRNMPGGSSAQYTIEMLPATGTQCVAGAGASASMLDSTGGLTIRSTGRVGTTKRTVVAQLRRSGFLDFLYFTDFETVDPTVYTVSSPAPGGKAGANCKVYRRAGRDARCTNIVFAGSDVVKGPFHTNDNFLACGSPTFGRNSSDLIEESDPAGFAGGCGTTPTPNFLGTYSKGTPTLQMPTTNASLKDVALPAYKFSGQTRIILGGSTMQVWNTAAGMSGTTVNFPSNGVVYVDGTCSNIYDIVQDYNDPTCNGDVYVKGNYTKSLTIAAKRDVIALGDITRTGNVVLGLIGDGFVRVYHPVLPKTRTTETCTGTNLNTSGANSAPFGIASPSNVRIDAAIMSVQHSFIVDNYYCGGTLGTLTINGAIAQTFRGPVGTGGATISTGYVKNYNYDDRFRVVNPPYFLDPVNSAWRLVRFNEQTPAT
ncbi:MAG: hypothetical protein QOG63_1273 [Thermoleophilaceae bacterium]|jgi:hypothetical protein|nr:hypothetical protein [Thermoleophilaceae bacterium]